MYKVSILKCDPDKLSKYIAKNKTKAKLYNNQLEVITVDLKKTAKALGAEILDFKECDTTELARIIEDLRKISAKPEQVKSEETKMSEQNSYKVNFQAPKINTENSEALEQSIGALKLAKSLNAIGEQELIYMSLIATGNMNLLNSCNTDQLSKLDNFIDHLRECYGSANQSLKRLSVFEDIKQSKGESDPIFFNRCFKAFYESRNAAQPLIANASETDKYLIKAKFTQKVNNPQVYQKLVENFSSLEFAKLGTKAKEYREAADYAKSQEPTKSLEPTQTVQVNAISRGRSYDRHQRNDRYRSGSRKSFERSKSRDRKSVHFDMKGFRCNLPGHSYKECKTSVERVKEYRARLDYNYFH